jgi:hypothetical protein
MEFLATVAKSGGWTEQNTYFSERKIHFKHQNPIAVNLQNSLHLLATFCLFTKVATLHAQDDNNLPPETFTISISHDNAFGFLPVVTGSIPLRERMSLSFYGNFWTNPSYAAFAGRDFWLEAGVGLALSSRNGQWLLNPSLGTTHGNLLSATPEGVLLDGVVPGVVVFHASERFEGELYALWYKALRQKNAGSTDYFLGWVYPGYRFGKRVSAGLHVENFSVLRQTGTSSGVLYTWLGAYAKLTVAERYWFRLAGGRNLENNGNYGRDYYRLTVGWSML